MDSESHFAILDYAVFAGMLGISACIGIYYRFTGGKQKTTNEYLLADRNMGIIPVAFSLMASFMSAVTLLGVASENYMFGTQFIIINIAYIFGTPFAAFFFLPVFFRMQATSAYEYLERRFGLATRLMASISFHLQMVFYMGIVLYAPALALSAVTGLSKWTSILSVGLVCTFYSTIGGMKAVLWTDVFQSLLMFAAVFAVLIKGSIDAGGLTQVLNTAYNGGRLEFFRMDFDPTTRATFWTQAIGGIFTYTSIYGVNQAQVQRLLTIGDLKKSQMALFLSWPILTLLSLTTSFSGLVIYYSYQDCDPLSSKRIASSDQLLPLFVMDYLSFYPGIPGLFVSGIFSATLSTVSSSVNSLAAVTLEDYIKPCIKTQWSENKMAFVSQMLVLFYGTCCLAVAFLAENLGGVLQASLTVFGVVGGPLLGLFSLGMFFTKSNQKGAVIGLTVGLGISCWLGFGASIARPYIPVLPTSIEACEGSNFTSLSAFSSPNSSTIIKVDVSNIFDNITTVMPSVQIQNSHPNNDHIFYLYRISYMWLGPIGFFITLLLGLLVSLVTGGNGPVSPDLISPPFHRLYGMKRRKSEFSKINNFKYEDNECGDKLMTIDMTSTECITKF